jgi:intracellular multiplication protein IcmP
MAAPQQSNQSEGSSGILWIIGAIMIFGGVIWLGFKKQIITFYFHFKLIEINFIGLFTNKLADVKTTILTMDPAKLSFQEVVNVGNAVGDILRIPFAAILVILAFVVYFANSTRVFKRTYNMNDLVNLEKTNWPQITPVAKLDLLKTNIDTGPWAMALSPMQFAKRYRLLEEYKRPFQEGMSHKEWNKVEVSLRRGQATKIFALQVGALWPGVQRLPPHIKALFAAFAARINGDGKGAADLLLNICRSSDSKLDFTGTDALLAKHENTKLVQEIVTSHAYLLTVMASMLKGARDDGVQASADFLWLKPTDRRLWYMLNTVGRQTPFSEVAGPFAHWVAEREIGRRLLVPMVEEATNALELALKEIVYVPDEKPEGNAKS